MADYDLTSFLGAPWSLALCGAILVAAVLAYRLLLAQWNRHQVVDGTRRREATALGIATVTALSGVAAVPAYLDKAERDDRMRAEVAQITTQTAALRRQIDGQVERVRNLLAERTVQHIEQDRLAQAQEELLRFAPLKDPRIDQMLALVERELATRALVAQSMIETAPARLHLIYSQLAERVPDNARYRELAVHYASTPPGAAIHKAGGQK